MTEDADDRRRPSFRDFNAVQAHVSLDNIEPRIRRRLIVPLAQRSPTCIPSYRPPWAGRTPTYGTEVGGLTYGDTWSLSERTDDDARVYDAQQVRKRDFSREHGVTFTYVYDFGDN